MNLLRDYLQASSVPTATATVLSVRPLPRLRTVQGDELLGCAFLCEVLVGTGVFQDVIDAAALELGGGYTPCPGDLVTVAYGDIEDGEPHLQFTDVLSQMDDAGKVKSDCADSAEESTMEA